MEIMKVLNTIIQILFWKVRWKKNEKENEPKYFHQRRKVFALQKSMYEVILFRIKERFSIRQPQHAEQIGIKAIREQLEKMIGLDFLIGKWRQDFNHFDLIFDVIMQAWRKNFLCSYHISTEYTGQFYETHFAKGQNFLKKSYRIGSSFHQTKEYRSSQNRKQHSEASS